MNILLVTPVPPQPQATWAIPVVLYGELIGLLEHHQVSLVTIAGPGPGELEAIENLKTLGISLSVYQRKSPQGLERWQRRWRLASTWMTGRYPWRTIWFWAPKFQHMLDDLLAGNDYDLVIVEDNSMGIYTYRTSTPLIFTEHEVRRPRSINWGGFSPKYPVHWVFSELDWKRWRRYQTATWQQFDRIQTFTDRDAKVIHALAPELSARVRVNPFGIVLPASTEPSKQVDNSVLFVGSFDHPPNVDAAVGLGSQIMPILRQLSPGITLDLIAIHPPAEVFSLSADDFRVNGLGADIEPYFERAAVVIAPLRIGGGMRMKVLHAMAMGKAVVPTPRGADGLAVDGAHLPLMIAEEAESFARITADLLANREKRIELGLQARSYTETHFNASAFSRRIETVHAEMKKEGI